MPPGKTFRPAGARRRASERSQSPGRVTRDERAQALLDDRGARHARVAARSLLDELPVEVQCRTQRLHTYIIIICTPGATNGYYFT